jgi:uncharacterized protein (TIGR03435 family)
MRLRGRPISDLADALAEVVSRPVIDKTGLKGRFDVDPDVNVNWDHLVTSAPADVSGPNREIFVALQEQLGLKSESTRGPVRTIVIDSAEKLSAN